MVSGVDVAVSLNKLNNVMHQDDKLSFYNKFSVLMSTLDLTDTYIVRDNSEFMELIVSFVNIDPEKLILIHNLIQEEFTNIK